MLLYIWKWKIATTAALHHKFFPKCNERTGYFRLNRLKKNNYIISRTDKFGQRPAWMLTRKGFEVVKDSLPDLKELGFRSEYHWHDLLCSALQQGDYFINKPKNVAMVSEQQLRRYREEDLPAWVPSPDLHRPDGYIRIKDGNDSMTISLEVEKSRKATSKLLTLINYYADFDANFRVLWVLDGKGLVQRLQSCMKKSYQGHDIHNIVLLKDFLNLGWQSKIISGPEENQNIQKFICNKARTFPQQTHNTCSHNVILDNRLCYQKDKLFSNSTNL